MPQRASNVPAFASVPATAAAATVAAAATSRCAATAPCSRRAFVARRRAERRAPAAPRARSSLRMMGAEEDRLTVRKQAQVCLDEGCSVEDLGAILERVRHLRDELMSDVKELNELVVKLQAIEEASAQLPGDQVAEKATVSMTGKVARLEDVIRDALTIFSRAEDQYPKIGMSPWTMDKPTKKDLRRF